MLKYSVFHKIAWPVNSDRKDSFGECSLINQLLSVLRKHRVISHFRGVFLSAFHRIRLCGPYISATAGYHYHLFYLNTKSDLWQHSNIESRNIKKSFILGLDV